MTRSRAPAPGSGPAPECRPCSGAPGGPGSECGEKGRSRGRGGGRRERVLLRRRGAGTETPSTARTRTGTRHQGAQSTQLVPTSFPEETEARTQWKWRRHHLRKEKEASRVRARQQPPAPCLPACPDSRRAETSGRPVSTHTAQRSGLAGSKHAGGRPASALPTVPGSGQGWPAAWSPPAPSSHAPPPGGLQAPAPAGTPGGSVGTNTTHHTHARESWHFLLSVGD